MKKKKHKKVIILDGKQYNIEHYDFLPPKTVGLSTDLYHKLKEQKDD